MVTKGINKVILVGNLGQDPEIRHIPNGSAVANITLATSDSWRDKQTGEVKEKTEWHRIVIFGKLAEIAGEYLHKGSQVYIEGFLQTRKWQSQSGQDHYITEVVVSIGGTMQMLGGKYNSNNNTRNTQNTWVERQRQTDNYQSYTTDSSKRLSVDIDKSNIIESSNEQSIHFDDDIPF